MRWHTGSKIDASARDTSEQACSVALLHLQPCRRMQKNQALHFVHARKLGHHETPQMLAVWAHLAACFPCLPCPAALPFNASSSANFGTCPSPPAATSPTLPGLALGDPAFSWAPFMGEAPSAVAGTYEHNGSGGLFGLLQGRACASRKALLAGPCCRCRTSGSSLSAMINSCRVLLPSGLGVGALPADMEMGTCGEASAGSR